MPRTAPSFSLLRRAGPWRDALLRRMLALADLGAVLGTGLALWLAGTAAGFWVAAAAPLWLVLAKMRGLYDKDQVPICHRTVDEAMDLLNWVTVASGFTALLLVVLPGHTLSLRVGAAMWSCALLLAFVSRTSARAAWRRLVPPERGLVVGAGEVADALTRKLVLESGHNVTLTAQTRLGGAPREQEELEALEEMIALQDYERVIVALQDLDEETLSRIVRTCRANRVKLSVAPPLRAMLGTAVQLNHLAELPLIEFKTGDSSRSTMLAKRMIDVAGAIVGLVVLFPLLLVIALAIRLDSSGPAMFRQRRVGRMGVPFTMFKFRTMVRDAETRLADVIAIDALTEPAFKLHADPRVTRVGQLLRRTSLDELPQLINVLTGEMSLVGPRPEETWLVERYDESARFRLEVRPGMTGPMQVHGRGELSFEERMAVEREYVENYSLSKDLEILARTMSAVMHGRGAF